MSDLVTSETVTEEAQPDAQDGESTEQNDSSPKTKVTQEVPYEEPKSNTTNEEMGKTDEEPNKSENLESLERIEPSDDPGIINQESDVLELDYGVDGVEDQLGTQQETEKVEKTEKQISNTVSDDLKDCRLLWISGVDQTIKANDFRIAFEPYGKVESGKLVMITVKGVKECKGIVTMKTVKGADDVIKHMNGSKIGDFVIQIEKRARDPTKPKEPKAQKEAKLIQLNNKRRLSSENEKNNLDNVKRSKMVPNLDEPNRSEIEKVERELADQKRAERRLKNRISDTRGELRKLKNDKIVVEKDKDKLKKDIRSLKDSLEKLKKEQAKLKDDGKEELRLLRKKKDDLSQTKKDISSAKDNVQKLRDQIRKLEEDAKRDSKRDIDSKLQREKEEREKLQAERKKLEEDRRKYAEERARLEKEKKNELERSRTRQTSPGRQVRRSPNRSDRTPIHNNRDQRSRGQLSRGQPNRSPPRNRTSPRISQNPQSARLRLGERPQSPVRARRARSPMGRRSPPRSGGDPKRTRSPINRKRSPHDNRTKQRLDQPKKNENRPNSGSGWGNSSPPKAQVSDGWGSSGGWGDDSSSKNGEGWGENVSWEKNGGNRNRSWGTNQKSPNDSSWDTSNDRNVTVTNDRTMIVSKPVDNSGTGWGTRHETGRKGNNTRARFAK